MTMIPAEFAPRKVRRKLQSDGIVKAAVTAADLFIRKKVGAWLFDLVIKYGIVQTLSRQELASRAVKSVEISNDLSGESFPFVFQIDSGYVLTETGLLMTQEFEVIEESAGTPEYVMQAMMEMCSRELFFGHLPVQSLLTGERDANPEVLETVAPLIPRYPTNYYHWMVETVPKVRYLQKFEKETGIKVKILVPPGGPPFINETLNLLDWPSSRIIHPDNKMYQVENLIVPSWPERTSADFDWIRNRLQKDRSIDQTDTKKRGGNRIYVSRSNAIERRVINETEVMEVLSEYGFKSYCLENRTLVENVRLFSQADIVVGPHGAGLTDIIFSENCTLLELFGDKVKQPYEVLAGTLGVEYEPMYCQADGADIIVDTDQLEQRLSQIVKVN